jgi:hypothetical protein
MEVRDIYIYIYEYNYLLCFVEKIYIYDKKKIDFYMLVYGYTDIKTNVFFIE